MIAERARNKHIRWLAGVLLIMILGASPASGGETLRRVKARKVLNCGVSEGIAGFSEKDAGGQWKGLDVEFCRAVAAATLGDGSKVKFKPLRSTERFPALKGGLIDLLLRNTTWTLGREIGLKVRFPGILFYDGQGFVTRSDSGVNQTSDLNGKAVCVVKGATHADNTANYFTAKGWRYTPVIVISYADGFPLLKDDLCQAMAGDISALAAARLEMPKGAEIFKVLPERITKEPLAPVVLDGDQEWASLVRWVLYLLINAEEVGLTQDNVRKLATDKSDVARIQAMETCRNFAAPLGIPSDWAVRVIAAVGNYGEIYERTLGSKSPYGLDRGPNRLWTEGGLMYAPPIR